MENLRCYSVADVPSFFVEAVDPLAEVLELNLGEQRVRLTKEAFYSMVGSLAKMAVELIECPSPSGKLVH
jgi:hypothetical protein